MQIKLAPFQLWGELDSDGKVTRHHVLIYFDERSERWVALVVHPWPARKVELAPEWLTQEINPGWTHLGQVLFSL